MALFGKKKPPPKEVVIPEEPDAAVAAVDGITQGVVPKPQPPKKKIKKAGSMASVIFAIDQPGDKPLQDPELESRRYSRVVRRVRIQAVVIIGLLVIFMLGFQLLQPSHIYLARRIGAPVGSEKRLVELNLPILTKEAILSWSSATVTEVLTFNFANFNDRLGMFVERFHPDGWKAFVKALYESRTIDTFKSQQLVSTATPSEPAILEFEGENPETKEYEWRVKVPVIRKFVTNNDRSDVRKTDVYLTIVRVPLIDFPAGMAIKVWQER